MNIYIYIYIYIYRSQSNISNRLQLYKISFLIGYKSICKVDICYNTVQGEVDCSLFKMCWIIDMIEFDPRWRFVRICLKFLISIYSFS